jgi:hypothetical protein
MFIEPIRLGDGVKVQIEAETGYGEAKVKVKGCSGSEHLR